MSISRFPVALVLCAICNSHGAVYDVLLRNGRVVDGTGQPARIADVGLQRDRIVAVGDLAGDQGKLEYHLGGRVIAPGFIDVHSHAENIQSSPKAENFVRMGVTSLVLGNCGSSELSPAALFAKLEDVCISANVATLIGHGTVRSQVMGGSFRRPPSEKELGEMESLVDQAMKEGALGFSTGLIYLPGSFSQTPELVALARVVARHGGIHASHMRSEGTRIHEALEELLTIGREAGVPVHVSHIKLAGPSVWGQTESVLERLHLARDEGLRVTQDQYMYTASSTSIQSRIPNWAREGGNKAFARRVADPEMRARIVQELLSDLQRSGYPDLSHAVIASFSKHRELQGKNVREAALVLRGSDSLEDQAEVVLDILLAGGAQGVFHGMQESDLQAFLKDPNTMIAADSSVRSFREGVPHPRGYGNNARCLQRYVHELGVLTLEEAVRRMTQLPAETFGLEDRGVIRPGGFADLVVMDPAAVRSPATFENPHAYATGLDFVLVNGVVVVRADRHTGAMPGRPIRHKTSEDQ